MTEASINQLAALIDLAFGKPGSAQVALAHLDILNALADAVKAAQTKNAEQENTHGDD
jgi:hypothetical protein